MEEVSTGRVRQCFLGGLAHLCRVGDEGETVKANSAGQGTEPLGC